jgi:hypothetical protein
MTRAFATIYAFAAVAVILALSACNPYLQAQSAAPPGRSARLDEVDPFWGLKYYRIEISRGVALAVTCNQGGPCEHVKVVSDSPAIADARAASLGVLERNGMFNQATSAAVVIVGKAPGKAHLHLTAAEGERDIYVMVVDAPRPGSAVTAAK